MEVRVICVVLVGLCLSAHSAPTLQKSEDEKKQENCDAMTSAIIDLLNGYANIARAMTGEEIDYGQLKNESGYNFSDPKVVRLFACKLVGVKSLNDLAKILNKPYPEVKAFYQKEQKKIQKLGGYDKVFRKMHIALDIFDGLSKTKFPAFPIGKQPSLEKFLNVMIVKYKSGFLKELNPRLINVTDVKGTARDLAEADNISDFAKVVRVHPGMLQVVGRYFPIIKPLAADIEKIVEALERMHIILKKTGFYKLN